MTYTSGTEALPKGVIITNQALMAEYMGCIVDGQYDEDDVQVNALPIYHCAQRDVFLNPVFWVGGTNILIAPDMVQILKNISDYKATMFFAPPTVWIGLLRHPDFAKYDLKSLKKCYYGASIMPAEILKEIMEKFPGRESGTTTARRSLRPITRSSGRRTPCASWAPRAWAASTWRRGSRTTASIPSRRRVFPARSAGKGPTP